MRVVFPIVLALSYALTLAGSARSQGTAEQREACAPDALKLCSTTVPDVAKTAECMKAHRAELSPRCQAALATETPARPDAKVAPPAPSADVVRRRISPPDVRFARDPDAEVPYRVPRRIIPPPRYSDPGPPLNPGGVPYDELFAGPTILDIPAALDELDEPYLD